MGKLTGLVGYFIQNAPYPPGRTEIVKLCYFFEYHHTQLYGIQYTDARFIRYTYGPYAYEIDTSIEELLLAGAISIVRESYSSGITAHRHYCKDNDILSEYKVDLSREYIAQFAMNEILGLPHNMMLEKVYSTPPMENILNEEQDHGSQMGRELNMKESRGIKKFSKEELLVARTKRLSQKNKGSDVEYYKHLEEQYKEFADLRERATKCHA